MIDLDAAMLIGTLLFLLGLTGLLVRRNLVFTLMSVEIMLNAAGFAFVVAGAHWNAVEGQIMYLLLIAVAAVEAAVGLTIVLSLDRRMETIDGDSVNRLQG